MRDYVSWLVNILFGGLAMMVVASILVMAVQVLWVWLPGALMRYLFPEEKEKDNNVGI